MGTGRKRTKRSKRLTKNKAPNGTDELQHEEREVPEEDVLGYLKHKRLDYDQYMASKRSSSQTSTMEEDELQEEEDEQEQGADEHQQPDLEQEEKEEEDLRTAIQRSRLDQGGPGAPQPWGSSSSSAMGVVDPNIELQNAIEQQSQLMGEKSQIEALQEWEKQPPNMQQGISPSCSYWDKPHSELWS